MKKKDQRPILGIDMDDVIADTYQQILDWYERDFGIRLEKEDLGGKLVREAFPKEHAEQVYQYFFEPKFFREIQPIPGAIEGVRALQEDFDVFIVTAAQQFPQSLTEKNEWLDEFMPFVNWSHRVFCGHKHFLGADYLIDDQTYNFEFFTGTPVLYSAPHNLTVTEYDRVNNWTEVREYFARQLEELESI